jgi:acyl dehydratase
MCLGSLAPDREDILGKLGVDIGRILHGEQHFTYFKPIYAGDTITLTTRVTDMYDKKGGALDFIVQETDATNQKGETVGATRSTIVVRNT